MPSHKVDGSVPQLDLSNHDHRMSLIDSVNAVPPKMRLEMSNVFKALCLRLHPLSESAFETNPESVPTQSKAENKKTPSTVAAKPKNSKSKPPVNNGSIALTRNVTKELRSKLDQEPGQKAKQRVDKKPPTDKKLLTLEEKNQVKDMMLRMAIGHPSLTTVAPKTETIAPQSAPIATKKPYPKF